MNFTNCIIIHLAARIVIVDKIINHIFIEIQTVICRLAKWFFFGSVESMIDKRNVQFLFKVEKQNVGEKKSSKNYFCFFINKKKNK